MMKFKNKLIALLIGISFMLIALLIQIFVQELPLLILILEYGFSLAEKILASFELSYAFLYALFIGGTAALFQEGMKLFAVKLNEKEYAFWVGIGFSIIDISFIFLDVLLAGQKLQSYQYILITLNILTSLIFHPGTAMLLKHGLISKKVKLYFPIAFIFHLLIDGGLIFSNIYVLKYPSSFFITISIFWGIVVTISVITFLWGRKLIVIDEKGYKNPFVIEKHD